MRTSLPRNVLQGRDTGWCLRANRWGEWQGVRRFFAVISRLGDGVFWYVLMGALIALDGLDGLAASAHLAATGCKLGFCVGGLIDFASGNKPRAPELVRRLHCEWIFRLMLEPRRLARRYLIGNAVFLARVARERLRPAGRRRSAFSG